MNSTDELTLQLLSYLLQQYRFSYISEKELQDGIELALKQENIPFTREHCMSKADRPDFVVGKGNIAIEVKIKGSIAELLRQINRYTQHKELTGILVIGTPHWLTRVPPVMNETAIHSIRLLGSLL